MSEQEKMSEQANKLDAYTNLLTEFLVGMTKFQSKPMEFDAWFTNYQRQVIDTMIHWEAGEKNPLGWANDVRNLAYSRAELVDDELDTEVQVGLIRKTGGM